MNKYVDVPQGGVRSLEELYDCELVRSEFLSPTFQAKVTVQYSHLTFNAAAVRLFPDTQHIQVLMDRKGRRMIVVPCSEHAPGRLKWAIFKKGKNHSRGCLAKITCAKIYAMMDWIPDNRYKIMAVYQEIQDIRLIVFNLVECEMLVTEVVEKGDGTKKKKIKVLRPQDWLESFGNIYRNHADAYQVDLNAHYLLPDNLTGEDKEVLLAEKRPPVQPREPSPVDIMRRQYGGVDREE